MKINYTFDASSCGGLHMCIASVIGYQDVIAL